MNEVYPFEEWLRKKKKSFKNKPIRFLSKNCLSVFVIFAFPLFQAIWTIIIVLTVRGSYFLSNL